MVSKINGGIESSPLEKTSKPTGKASGVSGGDKVNTSAIEAESSSLSQSTESIVLKQAPIDTQKVEAIKQAIRDGQFKVNSGAVADKIIDELAQMTGQKS